MMFRFAVVEFAEFFSRPLYWIGLIVASMLVLAGLDQLALDRSIVRVLVIDDDPKMVQGTRIKSLVREISGTETVVKPSSGDIEALIDQLGADVVLSKLGDRWQASLRSRSILDHRRLARVGFTIASVINRLTPWDTIISAEAVSPAGYGKTACEVAARMCAVYREIGDPKFEELCVDSATMTSQESSASETELHPACKGVRGPVLRPAIELDYRLQQFCTPDLVDENRTHGICRPAGAPSLGSVVSIFSDPQSHTRVFVPRTICLIVVFVAFVIACRSFMQETRNNALLVVTAMTQGRMAGLLTAKLALTLSFSLLLILLLLELSGLRFGISIKPGFYASLLPVAVAALSSAMLGLSIALVVRNELAVYAAGSMYLLILLVLSGYIDELKEPTSFLSIFSYVLPLKYIIAPFSNWMIIGVAPPLSEALSSGLLAQCLGSFVLLLIAVECHQRWA